MKVILMRGVPGSGKSTYVEKNHPNALVVSADHFFMEEDGVYRFDPTKLPAAHGACLKGFVNALQNHGDEGGRDLVVDNTSTSVMEVAPYAALALAYGAELEIVTVMCDPAIAARRNTHGVPETGVQAMHKRLVEEGQRLAPWWKHTVVDAGM